MLAYVPELLERFAHLWTVGTVQSAEAVLAWGGASSSARVDVCLLAAATRWCCELLLYLGWRQACSVRLVWRVWPLCWGVWPAIQLDSRKRGWAGGGSRHSQTVGCVPSGVRACGRLVEYPW